jgi:transcriptional regulator with XRE-family HTH domain
LEHGEFSPSLRTLRKVAGGLGLSVSQLFHGLDLEAERDETSDLAMLVRGRGPRTIARIMDLARVFLQALDEQPDGNAL